MFILRKNGATSNTIRAMLRNSSTGAGLTGLTSASSGLIISTITDNEATATAYTVTGATIETIVTLGTFAAPTATKCRFKEVDSVNHQGLYELHFADARFAVASAKVMRICVTGAASLLTKDVVVQLTTADVMDVANLPANVTQLLGTAWLTPAVAGTPDVNTKLISGDAVAADNAEAFFDGTGYAGTGNVIPTVTTLTNLPAITTNWLTATGIAADAITDAKVAADVTIASVTGAVGSVTGSVGSVTGNVAGSVGTVAGAVGSVTGAVGSVAAGGITAASFAAGALDAVWTTAARTLTAFDASFKTGYALSAAGVQAIWDAATTALTVAGSVGKLIVDNLNATVGSRATQTSVDTVDDFLDTEIASIIAAVAALRVKKNTALAGFMFPMVDSTDHSTPKTGATVTATRSLDGAAFAACANAVAEVSNGLYKIDLAAGDLNGNVVTLKFSAIGCDQRVITLVTQP